MSLVCPSCGADAPNGARFCLQCGTSFSLACPSCDTELPSGSRFCSSCGRPVQSEPAPAVPASTPTEERRLITVLFADRVGFTSQTEGSDPEDVRERLSTYHERVREDVERFGGRVEKLMGGGVFAVFGVPIAHEDDRERAVRAGLRIQESVGRLNDDDQQLEVAVRIVITRGEATASPFGHSVRSAERLVRRAIADAETIGAGRLAEEARSLQDDNQQQLAAER